jgi:glycosyltransferase involved in cell wall biosynthesis
LHVRVAFDEQIFAIQRHGGISRVFAELAHEFVSDPNLGVELQPVAAPLVNEYLLRDPATTKQLVIRPARHWAPTLTRSMLRRRHHGPADIVHNTFYLPRALADYPQAKRVVTIHDMIPELFPNTRRRLDFLTVKRRYVERADHIVCVSESTKRDLLTCFGPVSAPISVVYSGVGREFHPGADPMRGWPRRYLIYVGNRSAYKDAATLYRAFAAVVKDDPDLHLMLVGGGPLTNEESSVLTRLGIASRVRQEVVHDSDMPSAYGNALLFVFPSEYEGFGLPVLEAMASGTPMVLCDASSLPEVGGDVARYFPTRNDEALAATVRELIDDDVQRKDMRDRGLERVLGFSWAHTARAMADVYRATIKQGG